MIRIVFSCMCWWWIRLKNFIEKCRNGCRIFIGIKQIETCLNDIGDELIDSEKFKASLQNIRCKSIDLFEYQWIIVLMKKWVRGGWWWRILDRTLWERNNIFINLVIRRDNVTRRSTIDVTFKDGSEVFFISFQWNSSDSFCNSSLISFSFNGRNRFWIKYGHRSSVLIDFSVVMKSIRSLRQFICRDKSLSFEGQSFVVSAFDCASRRYWSKSIEGKYSRKSSLLRRLRWIDWPLIFIRWQHAMINFFFLSFTWIKKRRRSYWLYRIKWGNRI